MFNCKLIIAYEGTRYLGWQKTKMGPSIEEALEKALFQITRRELNLQAASRTDAGVHASGQVVNFFLSEKPDPYKLQKGLNAVLPHDICVKSLEIMVSEFHPTLHTTGKEYRYFVCNGPVQLPFHRMFSWHFPYPLDLQAMNEAAMPLIGTHDFSTFCNLRVENGIRTLKQITITPFDENRFCFSITGDHFLYKMVRNLVGTLVYTGCGKLKPGEISSILASKERSHAGVTAPAHGLTLNQVFYS